MVAKRTPARPKPKLKVKAKAKPNPLQNNNPRGRGGARPGAGRKPKAVTVAMRLLAEERKVDHDYAYSLFAAVMRDDAMTLKTRLVCAEQIMDRVQGKPTQHVKTEQLKKMVRMSPPAERAAAPAPAESNGHGPDDAY